VDGGPFASLAVGRIGEGMHAGGVDPAVIEVEEGADGDGEIDGFIVPPRGVEGLHVFGGDARRILIDLGDEAEEGFVLVVERGRFEVAQDALDELFAAEQFRRNCGVRLDSKRAFVGI
jgi:hypothetical protein